MTDMTDNMRQAVADYMVGLEMDYRLEDSSYVVEAIDQVNRDVFVTDPVFRRALISAVITRHYMMLEEEV